MAGVEELYKNFGVLADAGDKAGDHVDAYQKILLAIKGTSAEKKLACQFIPRFFKHFPGLAEAAIDAQLDLCEEEETPIRRQAIKSLPEFCSASNEHIPRITDILTQLLQQEDATELSIVRNGLEKLIAKDPESALGGIFLQISVGDDMIREKAIGFLTHLTTHGDEIMKDEKVGQAVLQEVKKALNDVSAEEFAAFITMLTKLKTIASNPQNLADLIVEQAELEKPFLPIEPESLNRIITCARQATPFFIKGASSSKYLEYLFSKVFPVFQEIVTSQEADYKLEVLKLTADLSVYSNEEIAKSYIKVIFELLIMYMPLPNAESIAENEEEILNQLNFSFVECFLYVLHQLGKKASDFFIAEDAADRLKDFRQRLTYFGRMTQVYIKQLHQLLQQKGDERLDQNENKVKTMALKTCTSINNLVKDFLHNPPSYKSNIIVSWKSKASPIAPPDETVEEKRKRAGIVPISLENLPKKERPNNSQKGFYKPPASRKGVKMDDDYSGGNQRYNSRGGNSRGGNSRYRWRGGSYNRGRRQTYQRNDANRGESHENFLFR